VRLSPRVEVSGEKRKKKKKKKKKKETARVSSLKQFAQTSDLPPERFARTNKRTVNRLVRLMKIPSRIREGTVNAESESAFHKSILFKLRLARKSFDLTGYANLTVDSVTIRGKMIKTGRLDAAKNVRAQWTMIGVFPR